MKFFTMDDIFRRHSCKEFHDIPVTQEALDMILRAATSGNDHGHLRPWEFRLFTGPGRGQLADAFVRHAVANGGDSRQCEKARNAPFRAPLIICVSTMRRECNIPFRDQIFSAAASCQLITLAVHLVGLAAIWKTGVWATSGIVRESLGIGSDDEIVGFIYIGTRAEPEGAARDFPIDRVFFNPSQTAR
ncbi:nitroreductase family protein [Paraburkholderia lacunae]|nr:nitroreductase [Paraburkholderia lacunae]